MKTKVFAISGLMVAALGATVALAKWPEPMPGSYLVVDQNKNVTMDFVNAPVSDVLDWMKKQGVSFVVEAQDVPKDKRLTVHIKNQPIDKALEAIADALGMNVTKKGQIYTLKSGFGVWAAGSDGVKGWTSKDADKFGKLFGDKFKEMPQWDVKMKDFKFDEKDAKKWEEMSKDWEKKWKDMPMKTYEWKGAPGKDGKIQWKGPDGKVKEMNSKEFEKMMQDQMKDMPQFEFKGLPEGSFEFKDMPAFELKMKELEKFKDLPEGSFEMKGLPEAELKKLKELGPMLKMKLKDMPKMDGEFMKFKDMKLPDMSKIKMGLGDIGRLVDSLTPAQVEKNKTQGYLTPDDLTPEQRKFLGDWGKGDNISITFSKDGKSLTIKNK